jgi:arylsulfatase
VVSRPFKGTINVDIRDSVPDWTPFEPPKAPDGAPSVVYIVLDDVGFSAMGCYGGPIETPNIDRIAGQGCAIPSGTLQRCARRPAHAC